MTATATEIKVNDIVELANGSRLIITKIIRSRPANPYVGVKERGAGAEYKFGYAHRPRVVGHAEPNHPALVARNARNAGVDHTYRSLVMQLCDAVDNAEIHKARSLAEILRTM